MPILTDVQSYAADTLRKLGCARHDQLHWIIGRIYPNVLPEKVMRQLRYLARAKNDGRHYICPGYELSPGRVMAIEAMLRLCGGALPIFDTDRPPCELVFFLMKADKTQAFRVYAPIEGQEAQCRSIAENRCDPKGHAVVFYVANERQIALLGVSRPHIFAVSDGVGGVSFRDAKQ